MCNRTLQYTSIIIIKHAHSLNSMLQLQNAINYAVCMFKLTTTFLAQKPRTAELRWINLPAHDHKKAYLKQVGRKNKVSEKRTIK